MRDHSRLSIEFSWELVGQVQLSATGESLVFPRLAPIPGVYRLWFESAGRPEVYIGETGKLRRRAGQFRVGNPTQRTSKFVHDHLLDGLRSGGKVTLWTVADATYCRDGKTWEETDLNLKEHRLLLENAALADAFADDVSDEESNQSAKVLNRLAVGRQDD